MRADETLNPEFIKPDFVYRSCSGNIQVPPLRERPGDVLFLALKNAIERAAILCCDGEVDVEDLGFDLVENSSITETSSMPAERVIDQVVQSLSDKQMSWPAVEKALIQEALR